MEVPPFGSPQSQWVKEAVELSASHFHAPSRALSFRPSQVQYLVWGELSEREKGREGTRCQLDHLCSRMGTTTTLRHFHQSHFILRYSTISRSLDFTWYVPIRMKLYLVSLLPLIQLLTCWLRMVSRLPPWRLQVLRASVQVLQ